MHCMDHRHAIHRVKACSSFPWIKQSTHLSVEKFWNMWNFQRNSLKLRYATDRYKCTSSAHALHGSLVRHSWCQSVLIIPLDQAIHPLVRCKTLNRIENRGRVIPVLSMASIQRVPSATKRRLLGAYVAVRDSVRIE